MTERRPIGKIFNILTLILVWSGGDHGRPGVKLQPLFSLFYFPTKHTQVYKVELATFLFDFLFNFFFVIFPCSILLINSLECLIILVFSLQYQIFLHLLESLPFYQHS